MIPRAAGPLLKLLKYLPPFPSGNLLALAHHPIAHNECSSMDRTF
jgi:hypothetical protein